MFLKCKLDNIYNNYFRIYEQKKNQFLIETSKKTLIKDIFNNIKQYFPPLHRKYKKMRDFCNSNHIYCSYNNIDLKDINFLEKTYPPCKHCDEKIKIRICGKNKYGNRKYKCKNCGKTYMNLEAYKRNYTQTIPNCIHCNSKDSIKYGKTNRKQRYKCKNCGKIYMNLEDYIQKG